jgi:uncharacterized membrane protein
MISMNLDGPALLAVLATFFGFAPTPLAMCSGGAILFVVGILAAKSELARTRGLNQMAAVSNVCFAIPLAAFGAEHFAEARSIMQMVPDYVPGHLFWAYFVGVALIAAALSIATKILVRWSGLLFGIMMFLFVAMLDLPAAVANHNRISITLLARELCFGGAGWVFAGTAVDMPRRGKILSQIGRVLIAIATLLFAVEQFLHPLGLPGVPLERQMPPWIPARVLIGYLTGTFLLGGGVFILLAKKTRRAATCLGTWIVAMVLLIYLPVLVDLLKDPNPGLKVEGCNYFFDTLLFGGAVLAVARTDPAGDEDRR